ncbi:GNAT family N-acetyltransferase [Streptomyces sp. NPDC056061]|uniref:GNAT family N-acetyltransferase n=1 Tax=Streptomyces sp. NPDC056061 TaxID=3345700 RepID=UPI0035D75B44
MPGWRLRTAPPSPSQPRRSPTRPPSPSEAVISTSIEPTLWIRADACGLGPYRADLVETYWCWEQDPALLVGYGRQSPESLEARTEGMAHQLRGENIRFTIYDLSTDTPTPAGVATLLPDHSVRTAEYVIMLASEVRGCGLGTAATRLTLDYAFHITNLRMVWLKVLAPNRAGIRAYEKAGFHTAGTLREAGYWLGEVCDEVVMDALAKDFSGPSAVRAAMGDGC